MSTNERPEKPVFFVDRDLASKVFLEILRSNGIAVEDHNAHFGPLTPDIEWIEFIGKRGWIGVSRNRAICKVPAEIDRIMESGARLILLVGSPVSHKAWAENFVRSSKRIEGFIDRNPRAFIAKLSRPNAKDLKQAKPGAIRMWKTLRQWRSWKNSQPGDK